MKIMGDLHRIADTRGRKKAGCFADFAMEPSVTSGHGRSVSSELTEDMAIHQRSVSAQQKT